MKGLRVFRVSMDLKLSKPMKSLRIHRSSLPEGLRTARLPILARLGQAGRLGPGEGHRRAAQPFKKARPF